jgi:WD40 repeat protein
MPAIDNRPFDAKTMALLCILLGCATSFGHCADVSPEQILQWRCAGNGWSWGVLGGCGSLVYTASVNPTVLGVWQWDDSVLKMRFERAADGVLTFRVLPHERWISQLFDGRHGYDCIGDLKTGKETNRWRATGDGFTRLGRESGNGKYLAAWNTNELVADGEFTRFGLVGADGKTFQNVVTLTWDYDGNGLPAHIDAVPSDDGKYIGVCIAKTSVAMIDLVNKKVLWTASHAPIPGVKEPEKKRNAPWKMVPLDTLVDDIAFAPDSKLIYAVGRVDRKTGGVWGLNVGTGEIVSHWRTPLEDVHELTSMSVSPDGRFVAVGTEPKGLVLLFSTKNGQCRALKHGGSGVYVTSFSPDSKRLATFANGQIKIWKLPEEAEGSKPNRPEPDKQAAK